MQHIGCHARLDTSHSPPRSKELIACQNHLGYITLSLFVIFPITVSINIILIFSFKGKYSFLRLEKTKPQEYPAATERSVEKMQMRDHLQKLVRALMRDDPVLRI